MSTSYTNISITALPDREVEIIGTIAAEKMSLMREKALNKLKESVEIDGFRKGNAPDALILQKVGEMRIMEEAAEIALSEEYPNILEEHKLDAIGRPNITITKLAPGNPLEFKLVTALMPEIKLGDYKKIAAKENSAEIKTPEVTESEVEEVIMHIRRSAAHQAMHEASGSENHNHPEIKDEDLPEITDEFVASVGGFKNIADFRDKIRQNIATEKTLKEKDKRRTATLEAIMDTSTIDMPKIIVDGELDKMLAQFKDDVARAGAKYEDYLSHIKKTEADLRAEWRDTAIKRAKSQIILNTIAREENIAPDEEKVKKEMETIMQTFKDADRFRVRMYVETFMTNDLVFQFLDAQK